MILRDYEWKDKKNEKNKQSLREKQNIKRRVYDALNVLISAGMIYKKDKKIYLKEQIVNKNLNEKYAKYEQTKLQIVI